MKYAALITLALLTATTILAVTASANAQIGNGAPLGIDGVYRPSGVHTTPAVPKQPNCTVPVGSIAVCSEHTLLKPRAKRPKQRF
jgi:hypothetical protein